MEEEWRHLKRLPYEISTQGRVREQNLLINPILMNGEAAYFLSTENGRRRLFSVSEIMKQAWPGRKVIPDVNWFRLVKIRNVADSTKKPNRLETTLGNYFESDDPFFGMRSSYEPMETYSTILTGFNGGDDGQEGACKNCGSQSE